MKKLLLMGVLMLGLVKLGYSYTDDKLLYSYVTTASSGVLKVGECEYFGIIVSSGLGLQTFTVYDDSSTHGENNAARYVCQYLFESTVNLALPKGIRLQKGLKYINGAANKITILYRK